MLNTDKVRVTTFFVPVSITFLYKFLFKIKIDRCFASGLHDVILFA